MNAMGFAEHMLSYTHALAASVLVGKVVLLSFVVAPVLARVLAPIPFGSVVRAMFPAYYALGMGAAGVGLVSVAVLLLGREQTTTGGLAVGLWAAVLAIEWYCRTPLTPTINDLSDRLKDQTASGQAEPLLQSRWDRLHRRSVWLNGTVLVLGLCLVGMM